MKFISSKHLIILAITALFFTVLPFIHTFLTLGAPPRVPVGIYNDTDYYYDRMQEVADGHPFLGNPDFFEHRDAPAPAFFAADWISAVPLILGLPLMTAIHVNLFLWSFIFLLLTYVLITVLGFRKAALAGSMLCYLELYLFIIRPVSMQVIFPFFIAFLIAYALWLREPESRKKMLFLGIAGASSAYVYTYAWQIVVVAFLLTAALFWYSGRKNLLTAWFRVFGIFILASLPLIMYTLKQLNHPDYWQTMDRIGLLYTHLPTAAALYSCLPVLIIFLVGLMFRRMIDRQSALFFSIVGLAAVAVTWSNLITGKDLELPQHVERFIIYLLSLATACLFSLVWERRGDLKLFKPRQLAIVTVLIGFLLVANVRYLIQYGPSVIPLSSYGKELSENIQGFEKPLSWLRENVREPSVIWGDPHGRIVRYVTMLTPHYVLWRAGGALHLLSSREVEERYLTANYFHLTKNDLFLDYQEYAGVGNSEHKYRTYNRKVKLCRMFRLDWFRDCGSMTTAVGYAGEEYFDDLYRRYERDIRPNISELLTTYKVAYGITDKETDTGHFTPPLLSNASLVYDDGRFTIYKLDNRSRAR